MVDYDFGVIVSHIISKNFESGFSWFQMDEEYLRNNASKMENINTVINLLIDEKILINRKSLYLLYPFKLRDFLIKLSV